MSKVKGFKAGDKVVAVGTGPCSDLYERGRVYEVKWVSEGGRHLEVGTNATLGSSHFMHERDFVEMCIDALTERYIDIEMVGGYTSQYPKLTLIPKVGNVLTRVGKETLLDHLYPTETPQQKQLRELEQEQIALAAKIAAVRDSM